MKDLRFDQLSVGMEAAFEAVLRAEDVDAFASLTGDISPLHMDAAHARSLGYPDRVAHGMLGASFFSTLVGVHLPGRHALLHEIKASFHKPIHPGAKLRIQGTVSYLNEAFKQAEIKAVILDEQGVKLTSALIKVGLAA